jgi:hypothetical protein
MERILYNQLWTIKWCPIWFPKFHSTATALLDWTNDWYMNIDTKMFNSFSAGYFFHDKRHFD